VTRPGTEQGRRTIMRVCGKLKMIETQVLEAAFSSSHINCTLGTDRTTGRADCLIGRQASRLRS